MKQDVRNILREKFRNVQNAYSALDFQGKGSISMKELLQHREFQIIMKKYAREDIVNWLYRDNIFKRKTDSKAESRINFNKFKEFFFPQIALILDNEDIIGGPGAQWEKEFMKITHNHEKDLMG